MSDWKRSNIVKIIHVKLYLISCLVALLGLFSSLYLLSPVNIDSNYQSYIFEIESGDSLHKVATGLSHDQVISSSRLFRIFTYLLGVDNKIHIGEYEITSQTRIYDLITKISTGDVKQYKITILEGDSFQNFLTKLTSAESLKISSDDIKARFIEAINRNNLESVILDFSKAENILNLDGLLYPDTYFYTKGDSDLDILIRAFVKINNKVKEYWPTRNDRVNKSISSPYQALVLASILEKETSDTNERGLVSGVIYNRLEKNMALQVDPTVIYALGDKYTGNLTKKDLSVTSDYNTYTNKGLPPTPIGFVSAESIKAALNPSEHNLLYFVAMGNGKHFFSADLDTHNKAVAKYQKHRQVELEIT